MNLYSILKKVFPLLREKAGISAVIEGGFQDNWLDFNYQRTTLLQVPQNATSINDNAEGIYKLYATTKDFKTFELVQETQKGLEAKLEILPFLPIDRIDIPRTVFTKDGRIFIRQDIIQDEAYLKWLPEIVKYAGGMFNQKQLNKVQALHPAYN